LRYNKPGPALSGLARLHSEKTLVMESRKRELFVTSHVQILSFLGVKMKKINKRKEEWCSPTI